MKVALVTDTHFGVFKGNQVFLSSSLRYFREFVVPTLKKHGIGTLIHLGDMFDNRSSLDIKVMNEVYKLFREDLKDFSIHILVGNHDSAYRDRIDVNSVESLREFYNVEIIDEPKMILDGKVALVPWITNFESFDKFMLESKPFITLGHFEILGGKINSFGVDKNDSSVDPNYFSGKTKFLFSGHYHHRSTLKVPDCKIVYIGNAYHLSRSAIGESKGITILDTDTGEFEFIDDESVSVKYVKVIYPEELKVSVIKGNLVDIHVNINNEEYNEKSFGEYVSAVESMEPAQPPYVKFERVDLEKEHQFDVDGASSIKELLIDYVSELTLDDKLKSRVIEKIKMLYANIENEE